MIPLAPLVLLPRTLTVGAGLMYARLEPAVAAAGPGDTILVRPEPGGYPATEVRITTPRLTLRSEPEGASLSGRGADLSGIGARPRAIVEFAPGSDGGRLEGFTLGGAHNASHNGAGVRISGAAGVVVALCTVEGNDMGVMSDGDAARDQRIERCVVRANGDRAEPGLNHNLYLMGASATVSGCLVADALTGHNLKSRARYLRVDRCSFAGGDNRQLDLVDAPLTAHAGADAVVTGCLIRMNPEARGAHQAIHFGQEQGVRRGTLHLLGCTVVSPFAAPAVWLDAPGAKARIEGCAFVHPGGVRAALVLGGEISGGEDWLGRGYTAPGLLAPLAGDAPSRPKPFRATFPDASGRSVTETVVRPELASGER